MGHDYMVIATIVDHFGLILESYQSNGDWVITDPVSKFQCRLRLNEAKKTQRFSRAPQDGLPQPGQKKTRSLSPLLTKSSKRLRKMASWGK